MPWKFIHLYTSCSNVNLTLVYVVVSKLKKF